MAIRVKHGGDGSREAGKMIMEAGLASLARALQERQFDAKLRQEDVMQQRAIAAQEGADVRRAAQLDRAAQREMQAAAEERAFREKQQSRGFEQQMDMAREQSRLAQSNFEFKYDLNAQREIAKKNAYMQKIMADPHLDEGAKQMFARKLEADIANIPQSLVPADPDEWDEWPEEARGGRPYKDENGIWVQVLYDRSSGKLFPKTVPPESTPEYQARRERSERLKLVNESMLKYQTTASIPITTTENGDTKITGYRLPNEQEVAATSQRTMAALLAAEEMDRQITSLRDAPVGPPVPQPPVAPPPQMAPPPAAVPEQTQGREDWWNFEANKELNIKDDDKKLPMEVGYASAIVRTYSDKFKLTKAMSPQQSSKILASMTPQEQAKWLNSLATLRMYAQQNVAGYNGQ